MQTRQTAKKPCSSPPFPLLSYPINLTGQKSLKQLERNKMQITYTLFPIFTFLQVQIVSAFKNSKLSGVLTIG